MRSETTMKTLKRWAIITICLLIGISAIAIRALYMNQPIRYDEAYTYNNLASVNLPTVLSDYFQPNNHIFHTLLVYITTGVFGGSVWALRLPAFVAGLLLVLVQYRVTQRFYGRKAGFIAATLVTFSVPLIEFSANARGYTLITLFTALLMLEAKRIKDNDRSGRWWRYILWCVLGLYTIPVMLYSVLGISLWLFLNQWHTAAVPERMGVTFRLGGMLALTALLTVLVYTPVFFNTGASSLFGNEFVSRLDWGTFLVTFPETLRTMLNILHEGFNVAIILLLVTGFFLALFQYNKISNDHYPVFMVLLGVVLVIIVLQQVQPFPRIWLILMPSYFMMAAGGITRVVEAWRWLVLPIIFLLGLSGYDAVQSEAVLLSERTGRVTSAPEAASYLETVLTPDDGVIAPIPIDEPVRYYLKRSGNSALADQVLNTLQYTSQDLLVGGTLYILAEEITAPEIIGVLGLNPAQLTLRTDEVRQFGDITLQRMELLTVNENTVLFADPFDEADLPGWQTVNLNTSVIGDELQLQTGAEWGGMTLQGTDDWRNYRVNLQISVIEQNSDYEAFYVNIRHNDSHRYVGTLNTETGQAAIAWEENNTFQGFLAQRPLPVSSAERRYAMSLAANGNTLTLDIDGRTLITVDDERFNSGGVRLVIPPATQVRISDLQITAITELD